MSEKQCNIRVRVYHAFYDCDTGCCGHYVELTMPDGTERSNFEFAHPSGDSAAWARQLAEDTIRDEWPQCLESIDWETLEVEAVDD